MASRGNRKKSSAFAMLVALAGPLLACTCSPSGPRWTDEHQGDGLVLSLAAGKGLLVAGGYYRSDSSGQDLRIRCYRATDGHLRWEKREDRALPNMSKVPAIEMDGAGDVLVGWDYWAVGHGKHTVVTKLSGEDGRTLWEWGVPAAGDQSGHLAVARPDSFGKVWVAGIHQVPGGEYLRFLALLDSSTGRTLWQISLNSARDANERRTVVCPLADGDALVVVPPYGGEVRSPWLIQRISSATGAALWSRDLLRHNDRSLPDLTWVPDDHHGQVVVFWTTVLLGKLHLERIAFDLANGRERWRLEDLPGDDFAGGIVAATLDENGNIVAWGRHPYETIRRKWWRWHYEEGFWFPETEITRHEQPLRTTYSGSSGTVLERKLIAGAAERINAVLTSEDSVARVLLLREIQTHEQVEPWSALFLKNGRKIRGPATRLNSPRNAALLSDGGLAVIGDPAESRRIWRITVW